MRDDKNMRKIIFIGKSGAGKTTLTQAMTGQKIQYSKTQYIDYRQAIIDTPGEYMENKELGRALALYAYEADVVGLLVSATEQFTLFPPNIVSLTNREVVGIITQIDRETANIPMVENWLVLAGCKKIIKVNSKSGEGVDELLEHLKK